MFKKILTYGVIAGLIVGSMLSAVTISMKDNPPTYGVALGYLTMLVALSLVFIAVKRYRDLDLGGVIRFWPAFGMGVAISFIAGIFYVTAWEISVAVVNLDFADSYSKAMIAQHKARGVSGEALAKFVAEMDQFKIQYANPVWRLPMVFAEIFPVGVLVSLISAALLRNSRFMPRHTG
ncbi:MAG: DUF4199 domain-containing protein [Betaproteobacteria bacterium]